MNRSKSQNQSGNSPEQILEQVPAPVMSIDRDFNVVFMNEAGCRFVGRSCEEIIGKKCYECISTEHCQTDQCRTARAMETGEVYTARNQAQNGKLIPIEYTASPLKNDAGDIIGGVEYIRDITAEVEAEKETREMLEILGQIPTPVMAVDLDYNITFMNQPGCDFLGKECDSIVGKKCYDVLQTPHCGTEECRVKQAIAADDVRVARNEARNGDDEIIPIEYTAAPLKDGEGNIIGGLEYVIDITKQLEFEETITEQGRMILEMSTPVVKVWEGVLLVPVIGAMDTNRSQQLTGALLEAVVSEGARYTILDVTGLPTIDTAVARHLLTTVESARILGAEVIITGFSPAAAQTLAQLGVDFTMLHTYGSLRAGLSEVLKDVRQVSA